MSFHFTFFCIYNIFIAMLFLLLANGVHSKRTQEPVVIEHEATIPECRREAFVWSSRKKLGEGGQGAAYLIKSAISKETFVYKKYQSSKDFDHERTSLASLNHKNIIKPLCVREKDNGMILPFLSHGDLSKNMPQNPPPAVMRKLAAQLILAVAYLHSQGIVHQDIKPANLCLGEDYHLELLDFGLATDTERAARGSGTLSTMAPEVALRKYFRVLPVHEGLDWWSVGATLWMMNSNAYSKYFHETHPEVPIPADKDLTRKPYSPAYDSTALNNTEAASRKRKGKSPRPSDFEYHKFPEYFEKDLRSLISMFLVHNPNHRRFSTAEEIERIKRHPYFKGYDAVWE